FQAIAHLLDYHVAGYVETDRTLEIDDKQLFLEGSAAAQETAFTIEDHTLTVEKNISFIAVVCAHEVGKNDVDSVRLGSFRCKTIAGGLLPYVPGRGIEAVKTGGSLAH